MYFISRRWRVHGCKLVRKSFICFDRDDGRGILGTDISCPPWLFFVRGCDHFSYDWIPGHRIWQNGFQHLLPLDRNRGYRLRMQFYCYLPGFRSCQCAPSRRTPEWALADRCRNAWSASRLIRGWRGRRLGISAIRYCRKLFCIWCVGSLVECVVGMVEGRLYFDGLLINNDS